MISLLSSPSPAWCPAPWWMLAKTSDISASVPTGPLPLQCQQQSGEFLTLRYQSVGLQTRFWQMLHFLKTRQCNDFALHLLERGACSVYKWINASGVSALVKKLNASGTFVGIYFVLVPSGTQLLDWRQVSVLSKTDEGWSCDKEVITCQQVQMWPALVRKWTSSCFAVQLCHSWASTVLYTELYITRCRKM